MGLLAVSLLVATVVYLVLRPRAIMQRLFWAGPAHNGDDLNRNGSAKPNGAAGQSRKSSVVMPPPPIPVIQPPTTDSDEEDEPTTPKATRAQPLRAMPPPPIPPKATGRIPTLPKFPAANSAQRTTRGPLPNRNPGGGLAPPPTHSSKPEKPSRKVTLDPGHSPLDWARVSGPNADLRGVEPSTPYLRVTPSMLKKKTGRKGNDAWMAINGKVYNVTPYAKFHPGGIPELMRGAARDGTRLFGEVHPWVNYETMLSACLVGLLVEEPVDGSNESEMDKMD